MLLTSEHDIATVLCTNTILADLIVVIFAILQIDNKTVYFLQFHRHIYTILLILIIAIFDENFS